MNSKYVHTKLTVFCVCLLLSLPKLDAHPGDGLGLDSKGNIYFTDVHRKVIWKWSPGSGLHEALKDHWSHGLCVDALDRVWVEVEVNNTQYSVVRIETDGKVTPILGPVERGPDLYGVNILADSENHLYFPHSVPPRFFAIGIRKRSDDGVITLLAGNDHPGHRDGIGPDALFQGIQAMRFGPDHSIFLVDKDSIRKVSPEGQVVTLFRGIKEPSPKYQPFDNGNPDVSNRVYGLDVDSGSGDLLVAYHGNRSILRISEMERQVIYRSNKPWSPVGVAISPDGVVIKESGLEPGSDQMGPRIRLLHKDKSIETLVTVP